MEFLRQEYWSGLPFPTSGDLSNPEINLHLLHWQADSLSLHDLESHGHHHLPKISFNKIHEAEYIMRNIGLEEAQTGIKITGRNINNLRYADDTTLMAESEEELKSLLMKVKVESETVGLKLNIQKTKIMESGSISS